MRAFDLAPGTAAIADWRNAEAVTVWSGDAAVSRTVQGGWSDVLLVNTNAAPAPVRLGWTRLPSRRWRWCRGMAVKRFFGCSRLARTCRSAAAGGWWWPAGPRC